MSHTWMTHEIRRKVEAGRFELSKHTVDQSIVRRILVDEIREAIDDGIVIEDYPDDKVRAELPAFRTDRRRSATPRPVQLSIARSRENHHGLRTRSRALDRFPGPESWGIGDEMVEERFVDQRVTYTLQVDGKVVIVENVPARVSLETGEQYFSPTTVERLQGLVWGRREPDRFVQTPVFEFAA